jgi:hypothetical protein
MAFETTFGGLRIEATDYHAGPTHLTVSDLVELGLELTGEVPTSSVARPWQQSLRTDADRAPAGPAVGNPRWQLPEGLTLGGFVVARVRDGLDVFMTSYDARPVSLGAAHLEQLGLRPLGEWRA